MRLLALDVGNRRIGVAISDAGGSIAAPLCVMERASKAQDFARIAVLLRDNGVGTLVIGVPLSDDDSLGPQARRIVRYAQALAVALEAAGLSIPMALWDEHCSTQRALSLLVASGHGARRRRQRIDATAAAVILQDYLDAGERAAGVRILDPALPAG